MNAGHNYPILVDQKNTKLLNKGCIGLGMLDEIPKIEIEKINIEANSILVCYTDGIVELENNNGVPFETDNLAKTIQSNFNLSMNELDHQIFIKLDDFRGEKEFLDDTAVMSCKFF